MAWGQTLFAMQPIGITLLGLLGLAWLLAIVVLRSGGPAHAAAYGSPTLSPPRKPDDFLAGTGFRQTVRPFVSYLTFALRDVKAAPANVLRRVDTAMTRPETIVVHCMGLVCVALVVASGTWFVSEVTATQWMGPMALLTVLGSICLFVHIDFAVPIATFVILVVLGTTAELTWRRKRVSLPEQHYVFYSAI